MTGSAWIETLRIFSASLPAIAGLPARPWNGRDLTDAESSGACTAAEREYARSGCRIFAAQAAHEYLSERAW